MNRLHRIRKERSIFQKSVPLQQGSCCYAIAFWTKQTEFRISNSFSVKALFMNQSSSVAVRAVEVLLENLKSKFKI